LTYADHRITKFVDLILEIIVLLTCKEKKQNRECQKYVNRIIVEFILRQINKTVSGKINF